MTNETNTQPVLEDFTMDPGLLLSVIKEQAGSLTKALLEGIMNSIDAGAPRVDVTLTETDFVITDGGRGFISEEEVRSWFGRFGTPHKEGDATFGRFRMGRGQMFSYAATVWSSNTFRMAVDIEKNGLRYELTRLDEPYKGCRIEGRLYTALRSWELKDTLTELRKFVLYTPKPVYVNGELYGAPPGRLKSWTYEDDYAFYKVVPGSEELHVYNQGVFVESMNTWRTGAGGVVVSKVPVKVNFARNSVMENDCPTWRAIKERLEAAVMAKLSMAKSLTEGERRFLARRIGSSHTKYAELLGRAKVLTDPTGKHLPLTALRAYDKFVYIEDSKTLACAVHGTDRTFVVTEALLTRFGLDDIESFVREMRYLPGVLNSNVEILTPEKFASQGMGATETLRLDEMSHKQAAAFAALAWLNTQVAGELMRAGKADHERELLLGRHKKNTAVAWTDGKTYITVNRNFLKMFDRGLDGVLEWTMTLVHEYIHNVDDSESHDHELEFYRSFHDTVFTGNALRMATLAQQGLVKYLDELKVRGQSRSRDLVKQLRPAIELRAVSATEASQEPVAQEEQPQSHVAWPQPVAVADF